MEATITVREMTECFKHAYYLAAAAVKVTQKSFTQNEDISLDSFNYSRFFQRLVYNYTAPLIKVMIVLTNKFIATQIIVVAICWI